jgi:ribosomal protein L7/L12
MVDRSAPVLAIDFGTANSIAVLFNGVSLDKVTDSAGRFIMPSTVFYAGAVPLIVGWHAVELGMADPECYKAGLKRELGVDGTVPLGDRHFSRVELVGQVLSFLRRSAEQRVGETIHRAVLTVPAAYDEYLCALMVDAGNRAGLDVVTLTEPVAAAFSEGALVTGQRILIYDFGAGTFDAAVVEQVGDGYKIVGHAGLPHCGGLDIDEIIYRHLCSLATEPSQRAVLDGTDNSARARGRRLQVQDDCRQQKELLSEVARVRGDSLVLDPPLNYELTREWLETATDGLLHETTECCQGLLRTCGLSTGDLDHVLLVGGSSHAPAVRRIVEAELSCQARLARVSETAVAEGAAYWAWNTWQLGGNRTQPEPEAVRSVRPDEETASRAVGPLAPEYLEVITGKAEVRKVFQVPQGGVIAGCYTRSGRITRGSKVRLLRDGAVIWKGEISSLKHFKDDMRELREGLECDIGLSDFQQPKSGDVIETYEEWEDARGRSDAPSAPHDSLQFDVVLTAAGDHAVLVMKELRVLMGISLMEAKALIQRTPERVLVNAAKEDALAAREKLEHAGATVELRERQPEIWRAGDGSATPDEEAARSAVEPSSAPPENLGFDVVLSAAGTQKIQVIKAVRELTGLGLKEAKDLVDSAPKPVLQKAAEEDALVTTERLERAGATVELREHEPERGKNVAGRSSEGGSAADTRSSTSHVAAGLTAHRRTSGEYELGEPRTLVDGIGSPADVAVVGQSCWILRDSPHLAVAELLRVDLPSGEVADRLSAPGAVSLAASPGGVVLSSGDSLQVYDTTLQRVREWKCRPGQHVIHVEATSGCAWGLAEENETRVNPRASVGVRCDAKIVRIDFPTGDTKEFELGPDTFWTSPTHYRGMQLMPLDGCMGREVVALRCEWTTAGFLSVRKTKKASFVSELTTKEVSTHDVNTYIASQVSPPDLRQVLRCEDRILLSFSRCTASDAPAKAATTRLPPGIAEENMMSTVYEVPGTRAGTLCYWLSSPVGPVLLAGPVGLAGSGDKEGIAVLRLPKGEQAKVECATLPGDVVCSTWTLDGTLRELRIPSAVRGQQLWWGMSDPSGIVCLDGVNQVRRFALPGDPSVFAVEESAYVVARGARGFELQAVPVPP